MQLHAALYSAGALVDGFEAELAAERTRAERACVLASTAARL